MSPCCFIKSHLLLLLHIMLLYLVHLRELLSVHYITHNLGCFASLFADDFIYRSIQNHEDCGDLQNDLHLIEKWCPDWLITINFLSKQNCFFFTLWNLVQYLQKVLSHKYLGIHPAHNFSWKTLIEHTRSNANRTPGFLRHHLHLAHPRVR